LWCDDGFAPKPEYLNTLKEHYWAEIQALDFRSPVSAGRVNSWAQEKTRGRIPTIVASLAEYSPLLAMNAVYFKGLWAEPFKVEQTREEEFTLQDGTKNSSQQCASQENFVTLNLAAPRWCACPTKAE